MGKILCTMATIGFVSLSTAALAAAGDFNKVDADQNGLLTLEEVLSVHGDWTEANFREFDVDSNGALSQEEYEAAMIKTSN